MNMRNVGVTFTEGACQVVLDVECFFKGHNLCVMRLPRGGRMRFCKRCGAANPNMAGGLANWVKRRKRAVKRGARRLVALVTWGG